MFGTGRCYWLREYSAATDVLGRAVELGRTFDDPFTLSLALRFLGDIAINVEGDVDKAETLLDESLAAAEAMDEPWACTRTLLFAGWVPWTRGDHEAADRSVSTRQLDEHRASCSQPGDTDTTMGTWSLSLFAEYSSYVPTSTPSISHRLGKKT